MNHLDKIREFFSGDTFAKDIGIEIVEVKDGSAKCKMEIDARHKNARDVVMGGAIFTLCDFCFAVGANSLGRTTVTQSSSITFLRPATTSVLFAYAQFVSKTSHTCYYEVSVTDEKNVLVAKAVVDGYITNEENHLGEEDDH